MMTAALFRPFLAQRERWFFALPGFMGAGIALYFSLEQEPAVALLRLSPVLALALFLVRRRDFLRPLAAALLALALGFNAAQIETRLAAAPMLNEKREPVSLYGFLVRAEALPEGARLTLKKPWVRDLPKDETPRLIRLKVRTPLTDLPEPGSRVNVWGPLWPPGEPVAPGGYDFRRNAFFKGLGASGMAYSDLREREARYPLPFFWDGFFLTFEKARRFLSLATATRLTGNEGAMTAALLSGSQTGIDQDTMQAMRVSGLSHLLSISGVHVSMIGLLLYLTIRAGFALFPFLALRWPIKKIAAVAAIAGTALYTILVGADAPTVRSALMTGTVLFAVIVDRKALSFRIVALAAMLIMLVTPSAAMGPSFQMSFAAVLAMIAAYEKKIDAALKEGVRLDLPHWLRGATRALWDIVLTSLVATAATAPFTVFHFQTFSFYGVIANMIAIPLTSFWIMPCLLLTYLAAPFGLTGLFIDGTGAGVKVIIKVAETVAAWPWAQFYLPPMPSWAFALFLIGGGFLCLWRGRVRWAGLVPIGIACLYPLSITLPTVFIAPEGDAWAVRLADGPLATYGKRGENFTIHQWRQRSMNAEVAYYAKNNPPAPDSGLSCDALSCRFEREGLRIVFLSKKATPETVEAACGSDATFVVAPFDLPNCSAAHVIDAQTLRRHGAHTITLSPQGPVIETTRTPETKRPWTPFAHADNS